ncbi:MAG: regulatory protein RecX [Proteobacteria bacterium]|nr:regulatory protein RecX [Pseudomonadota bacterium]
MRRRADHSQVSDRQNAYDRGLSMLARREHSQRELRTRLEHGGYDEAETADALKNLHRDGYQSEERFGGMILRARAAQGYGPARVRAELRSHGLADAAIRALLEDAAVDWAASARTQLRKKYGGKPARDHTERGRRAAFLLRRGFDAATVRAATHAERDD